MDVYVNMWIVAMWRYVDYEYECGAISEYEAMGHMSVFIPKGSLLIPIDP
jgi:hypothetical protein